MFDKHPKRNNNQLKAKMLFITQRDKSLISASGVTLTFATIYASRKGAHGSVSKVIRAYVTPILGLDPWLFAKTDSSTTIGIHNKTWAHSCIKVCITSRRAVTKHYAMRIHLIELSLLYSECKAKNRYRFISLLFF